jgi:hypothetical protein
VNPDRFPEDDLPGPTASVPSAPATYRIALIDLTTAQLIIDLGEPTHDDRRGVADRDEGRAPAPVSPHCSWGRVRPRIAATRARHFGEGRACP